MTQGKNCGLKKPGFYLSIYGIKNKQQYNTTTRRLIIQRFLNLSFFPYKNLRMQSCMLILRNQVCMLIRNYIEVDTRTIDTGMQDNVQVDVDHKNMRIVPEARR